MRPSSSPSPGADRLAAAAAHELGTPLATISLVAKELSRAVPADLEDNKDLVEDLKLLQTQSERCRDILRKLTEAPAARDPMHAHMTIRQLIDEAAKPYRGGPVVVEMKPGSIDGAVALGPDGSVIPEPEGERQPGILYGLGNLIENAVDYANRRVTLTAAWDEHSVSVAVELHGDDRERVAAHHVLVGARTAGGQEQGPVAASRAPSPDGRAIGHGELLGRDGGGAGLAGGAGHGQRHRPGGGRGGLRLHGGECRPHRASRGEGPAPVGQ